MFHYYFICHVCSISKYLTIKLIPQLLLGNIYQTMNTLFNADIHYEAGAS